MDSERLRAGVNRCWFSCRIGMTRLDSQHSWFHILVVKNRLNVENVMDVFSKTRKVESIDYPIHRTSLV